jgi:hypothetical protein
LLEKNYKNWPKNLPVPISRPYAVSLVLTMPQSQLLLVHGTDDQVTSNKATQSFYEKVVVDDKKLSIYEVHCVFSSRRLLHVLHICLADNVILPLTGRLSRTA